MASLKGFEPQYQNKSSVRGTPLSKSATPAPYQFALCPQEDLNLCLELRRLTLCPLSYEGKFGVGSAESRKFKNL